MRVMVMFRHVIANEHARVRVCKHLDPAIIYHGAQLHPKPLHRGHHFSVHCCKSALY